MLLIAINDVAAVGLYSLPWNLESLRPNTFSCFKCIETDEKA